VWYNAQDGSEHSKDGELLMPYGGYSYCKTCGLEHNNFNCPRCESMSRALEMAFGKDKSLVFEQWIEGIIETAIKNELKRYRPKHEEEF